jgi:hypothetical protein
MLCNTELAAYDKHGKNKNATCEIWDTQSGVAEDGSTVSFGKEYPKFREIIVPFPERIGLTTQQLSVTSQKSFPNCNFIL